MSTITVRQPVQHIPRFRKWLVSRTAVGQAIAPFGLEPIYPYGVHASYIYTDDDGVAALLPNLILKSSLYKEHVFSCINYAFEVWQICGKRYGLNTWVPVIGRIPNYEDRHAWVLIMVGNEHGLIPDKFLYFEPNDGWMMGKELEAAYQAFPIGSEGYKGELIFY